MGADAASLTDISMEDDLKRAPSQGETMYLFVSCENLQLELPSSLNYTQQTMQTMQRGLALAKTMIKKEANASTPWEGYTYGQITVLRSGNAMPLQFRTEARREANPSYIVAVALPLDLLPTDSCVIEIVAQYANTSLNKVLATTSNFDFQVILDARAKQETLELPLDAPSEALVRLHWPHSMPLQLTKTFVQTHRKLYRWNEDNHMQEDIAEVPLCASLPQQLLQQSLDEFQRKQDIWQSLLDRAALQECRFSDDAAAIANGCDAIHVAISRARGLQMSAAPPLASSDSVTQALRTSMFALAKSVKTSAFSKLKGMNGNGQQPPSISTEGAVNAYCEVSYNDPKTFDGVWRVGKTNTILNNPEPMWEPEGVVPKLQTTIQEKQFVFYRPPNPERRGYIEGQVLVDPAKGTSTRSNRKSHISLGFARVELQQLKPTENGFKFHDWVRVHQREGDSDIVCRCDGLGTQCVGEVEIQITIQLGQSEVYPSEFPPLPVVSSTDVPWLQGSSTMQIQPMMYTTSFIEKQISAVSELKTTFSKLIEVSENWKADQMHFKSSQDKKTWSVQHIPTNLHICWAQSSKSGVLPTVTCGIPAAHALGLDKVNLSTLDEQYNEAVKEVHTLQAPMSNQTKAFYGVLELENENYSGNTQDEEIPSTPETPKAQTPSSRLSSLYSTAKRNLPPALTFKSEDKSIQSQITRAFELQGSYHFRRTVVVTQALTAITTCFQGALELVLQQGPEAITDAFEQWKSTGFLCGWESLVSSQGKELNMLLDAHAALDACRQFQFQLVSTSIQSNVQLFGSHVIQIPVDDVEKLPLEWQNGGTILITCVLFTQGINEMQSLANMSTHLGGSVSKQSEINSLSLIVLENFYNKFKANIDADKKKPIDSVFQQLKEAVMNENGANKNTDILHLASKMVRLLGGGRVTCCKSGKDRTAMSVTYEQAQFLNTELDLLDMANVMREYGVRLDIAFKNVGNMKYSFNALQRKLLPTIYRPPMSTIQDIVTSVALRDS